MKKKIMTALICAIAVLATAAAVYLSRPPLLGNLHLRHSEPATGVSDFSFHGEAGDRIKFSLRSEVDAGTLDVVLYDSAGNPVEILDQAKALETFATLDNADTYTLAAEYHGFVGTFRISVYGVK